MKRTSVFMWILLFAVPILLFLNTYQAFRYDQTRRAVQTALSEQQSWIEANKRAITSVSALTSPARIERLASEYLELRQTFGGPRVEAVEPRGNQW